MSYYLWVWLQFGSIPTPEYLLHAYIGDPTIVYQSEKYGSRVVELKFPSYIRPGLIEELTFR